MTEYPIEVMNRARETWLNERDGGVPLSFAEVARRVNNEFGLQVTRKAVAGWADRFAWSESPELAGAVPPPTVPATAPGGGSSALSSPVEPDEDEEFAAWDWEERKLKFLGKLASIADDCLAVLKGSDGLPAYSFKDTESRVKTGLAAVEMIGKINSGKFEKQEAGDTLPALTKQDMNKIMNFFFVQGAPEPKISPVQAIDVEFTDVPSVPALPPPTGEATAE